MVYVNNESEADSIKGSAGLSQSLALRLQETSDSLGGWHRFPLTPAPSRKEEGWHCPHSLAGLLESKTPPGQGANDRG